MTDGAPYQRIAAHVRQRIATGALRPGDRVPSTRQLARDWGVALATATRALTTLRQQGVVTTVPRVGTVVAAPASPRTADTAPPPPTTPTRSTSTAAPPQPSAPSGVSAPSGMSAPPAPPAPPATHIGGSAPASELTRARIVDAAIALADAEGLNALSMRAIAARLGVGTMTPYRHVADKEELVLLMADAAYGAEGYPDDAPDGWRARLEQAAHTLWRIYRRHPWLAQIETLSRPLPLPNLLVHGERMLAALSSLGLPPRTVFDLQVLLYSHGQSLAAQLERETHAVADTGLSEEQWNATHAGPILSTYVDSGRYPAYAAVLAGLSEHGYDFDLDRLFTTGLDLLLDAIAVRAEPTTRSNVQPLPDHERR